MLELIIFCSERHEKILKDLNDSETTARAKCLGLQNAMQEQKRAQAQAQPT